MGIQFLTCSGIRNRQDQDICCPNLCQSVHYYGNLLLLDHRTDCHPTLFFQRVDGRGPFSGSDFCGSRKFCAFNVVLAKNIFLSGWKLLARKGKRRRIFVLMTPNILEAIRSTKVGFVGFFDLMRTAVLDTTLSIAFKPAAFIVSPDSGRRQRWIFKTKAYSPTRSTIPSATPSAHAASTLPLNSMIFVFSFLFPPLCRFVPSSFASRRAK